MSAHLAVPPVQSAAIIGLGLIGGSVARDLAALGVHVLGYDADAARVAAARTAGVVAAEPGAFSASLGGLATAEMILLAIPVSEAPAVLHRAARHMEHARLITDVGSTKRAVVRAAEAAGLGPRFVGAHPLAGDHRSGWEASRAGLFRDAQVYLTPAPSSTPEAIALAETFWAALGAHSEVLDAGDHDARLAWTSHLPQVAASALALVLSEASLRRATLGPGGRDATRLAASDAAMWTAIAAENADALGPAIASLEHRLADLRAAAERGDIATLRRLFDAAQRWATQDTSA